jgi:hypothetical protein
MSALEALRLTIQVADHICSRPDLTTWYLGTEQSKYLAGLPLFQEQKRDVRVPMPIARGSTTIGLRRTFPVDHHL